MSEQNNSNTAPTNELKEIENVLANLDINAETHQPNDCVQNAHDENLDDAGFLEDVLGGANDKLNLTADEKDDLDDLNDEEVQKEYAEFMKNIANNTNANDMLSQLHKLMESSVGGDFNMDTDFGDFGDGNQFDAFTDKLIDQFIDKEVIYEPLKEAKLKMTEYIDADEAHKTEKNEVKLALISQILELFNTDAQNTREGKETIMQLFEELQEQGGFPEEIVRDSANVNPELANLTSMIQNRGCNIF